MHRQRGWCTGASGAITTEIQIMRTNERFWRMAVRTVGGPKIELRWRSETSLDVVLLSEPALGDELLEYARNVKGVQVQIHSSQPLPGLEKFR